jgi:hypothetical protein
LDEKKLEKNKEGDKNVKIGYVKVKSQEKKNKYIFL